MRRAALLLLLGSACHSRHGGNVPKEVDAWARTILAMPVAKVCADGTPLGDAYFCDVKPALLPDLVRELGCTSLTLQNLPSSERYLDFDWGGGHEEAHGILIGPEDWTPDTELYKRKLRDGVYTYDRRDE